MTTLADNGHHSIPASVGVGLRSVHYGEWLETLPDIGWLEVHSENYFGAGGQPHDFLQRLRQHYPMSFHGVGLSLGSCEPLNMKHLERLKQLVHRYEPALVSEHLCWGQVGRRHLNDLLPLPYTEEALEHMTARVDQVQNYLGRQLLIENVSSYLQYRSSTLTEWDFIAQLALRTGCGLIVDVNNIYVSACNHGFDADTFINAIPQASVKEIHLAGFETRDSILVDTHSRPVCDAVWSLYEKALQRFGPLPSLIEWDNDIPPLATLLTEADKAEQRLKKARYAHVA
ncbi:MAG: MNIO family bufferin maturase [bacterium]